MVIIARVIYHLFKRRLSINLPKLSCQTHLRHLMSYQVLPLFLLFVKDVMKTLSAIK